MLVRIPCPLHQQASAAPVTLLQMCVFTLLLWLLQVALRKVLQVIDPRLSAEEASSYIVCSSYNADLNE
jgi:hypothetical protein